MKIYLQRTILMVFALLHFTKISAQNLEISQPDSVRQAKIGMPIPYFKAMAVDGKNLLLFEPTDLCGKVTILEVWHTKGQSTKKTVNHHETLQQRFKENLQVIFISDESLSDVTAYVEKNPAKVYLAMDAEKNLNKNFPHTTKPHTIIVDADGYIRAITYPEEITEAIIRQVIDNQPISTKLKNEFTKGNDANFVAHSAEPMYKSLLTTYDHTKNIAHEWVSTNEFYFSNFSIPSLYQSLYFYTPVRTIIDSPKAEIYRKDHNSFVNFEMKIPNLTKSEVIQESIAQLNKVLPLKSKIDMRTRMGYALVRNDDLSLYNTVSNTNSILKTTLMGNHLKINGLIIRTLREFISVIEMYGLVNKPIINNTGFPSDLPISIEGLPAEPALLNEALKKYGLKLIEKEFTTEYLVLFEENQVQTTMK